MKRIIAVIGSGQSSPQGNELAEQVGRLLAERGAVLVCGGLAGIMAAAARGCQQAGGEVLGILPGDDAAVANPYVTLPVVTAMGHARNVIIAQTAQALIAVEGEYGTLAEIAIGLKLGKPVVQLGTRFSVPGTLPAESAEQAVKLVFNVLEGDCLDAQRE
ncbi:MAG: TIGR00725 family protein [Desulfuromonadales bacterium]|nr:TIGR00725 family protein [Desulfuromonadales bacterium]